MKRIILLLTVLLAVYGTAASQTHYTSTIDIGVRGGADMSKVFFHPAVKQTLNFGATAGVTFRYIEERHFGLIAELNFSQRGWKEDFEDHPFSYCRTLNYLQIPIFAHIYFGRRGRFFINLGPEFGLLLSDRISSNFDPYKITGIPDFPSRNRMTAQLTEKTGSKFDYGISAGLGGEFFVNQKNSISLEARFYYGIGNVFRANRTDPFQTSNQMTVSFSAGYQFKIK